MQTAVVLVVAELAEAAIEERVAAVRITARTSSERSQVVACAHCRRARTDRTRRRRRTIACAPGRVTGSVIPRVRMCFERRRATGAIERQRELASLGGRAARLDHDRVGLLQRGCQSLMRYAPPARLGRPIRPLSVRAPEERRVGDDDVREHVVVNVAAERDDSRLIERDRRIRLAPISGN